MDRRELLSLSAVLPLLSSQGMSAMFENRNLNGVTYGEGPAATELLGTANQVSNDMVDYLIHTLATIQAADFVYEGSVRIAILAMQDVEFLEALDRFSRESNGLNEALKILHQQPEQFLGRPVIVKLTTRLADTLISDGRVFLKAANRLRTGQAFRFLPPDLPVSETELVRGETAVTRAKSNALAASIGVAAAAEACIPLVGPIIAAPLAVAAAAILLATQLIPKTREDVESAQAKVRELIRRSASEKTHAYVQAASELIRHCEKENNLAGRVACLEAALLLISDSSR